MVNSCLNVIVKKDKQEINLLESDINISKDLKENNFKTTNVNILLNRVRLDKKRTFKKRIVFSFFLVAVISSLTVYFII